DDEQFHEGERATNRAHETPPAYRRARPHDKSRPRLPMDVEVTDLPFSIPRGAEPRPQNSAAYCVARRCGVSNFFCLSSHKCEPGSAVAALSADQSPATGLNPPMWDADQYLKFADERSRPFFDLLAQVTSEQALQIADLGCGPGNLTRTLLDRWPGAHVVG